LEVLVEVVEPIESLPPFLLFLCFLLLFIVPLLSLIVLLDEVFCAKTAVPERRDSPKVATMIFFI
jgi:hypothetical protein